jgi:hypothetical protein
LEIKQVSGGVEVTLDIAPILVLSPEGDAMLQPHDLNHGLGIDPVY